MKLEKIMVIGSGQMGNGIAQVCAQAGYDVYLNDMKQEFAEKGLANIVKNLTRDVEKGRKTRPNIKLGICGEHGGDPSSIEFCHKIGLNYVSCSPYRVPIAKLAAAQAAINEERI